MFVVVVTLQPRPLPSLGLDERFTRIDYTAKCTMLNVLEDMARVLRVPTADITLLEESGERAATLEHTLDQYHEQHAGLSSSSIAGKWHQRPQYVKRERKLINLKVKHTPLSRQLVTCTVEGGEGRTKLRRATVKLPNTATFGALLELARKTRHGVLEFEGPVYGRGRELETTLRETWVRNGCKIDGSLHIGLAVVVSFPAGSQRPLYLVMGPGDTVNEVKQKVHAEHGFAPSQQKLMICGGAQQLDDSVALDELLVSGVPVGGFSSAGWSELRLELRVRECALPLDSSFKATPRDESIDWSAASLQNPAGGAASPASGAPRRPSRTAHGAPRQCPPLALLDPHDARETKASSPVRVGGGSGGDGMTVPSRPGGSLSPIVVFALSPTGRVFTLALRGRATVLDAKGQIAGFEAVSPCRQRLLWRGKSMEPESVPLRKLGVRNGDTLIVGYKLTHLPGVTPSAAEQQEYAGDDALVAEATGSQRHYGAPQDENHVLPSSDRSNDDGISAGSSPTAENAEAAADGDESDTAVAERDNYAAACVPANARARSDGVGFTGGRGRGGGRADRVSILPSGSAAGRAAGKAAGRRCAWWSRKKSNGTRRPGGSDEQEHGRDHDSEGEVLEAAGESVPPSALSSSIIFSPNPINARRAHVVPASEESVRPNASSGAGPPPPTSAGRTNLAGWGRWGRRMPAFPAFSDGSGGGRG